MNAFSLRICITARYRGGKEETVKNSKQLSEILLNPVRMRIVQYFITAREGTISQLAEELTDIPKPTLYRHVNMLAKADILIVVREAPVRGAMERTYSINPKPLFEANQNQTAELINCSLIKLIEEYGAYFKKEENDPIKDMLLLTSAIFLLDDKEFAEFIEEYGKLVNRYLENKPAKGRKLRKLTIISSPIYGDGKN